MARFFDTYQSSSDWTKALWLIVPPAFLLALIALILRYRVGAKLADHGIDGELFYAIYRDGQDQFHIHWHGVDAGTSTCLGVFQRIKQ